MAVEFSYKPKAFYRVIKVREKTGKPVIEFIKWDNMKFNTVCKWEWYFKYRAALLQIKYPKYLVELIKGSEEPEGRTKKQIEFDLNRKRITTCKRMITKCSNALISYEEEQKKLLLPFYENPNYLKVKDKKKKYEIELEQLTN